MIDILGGLSIEPEAILPLLPILLGSGVGYLGWGIPKEEDLERKLSWAKQVKLEYLNEKLCYLLINANNEEVALRGEAPISPDLVARYTNKTYATLKKLFYMEKIFRKSKILFNFLSFSSVLGIVIVLLFLFTEQYRLHYIVLSVALIALQIFSIVYLKLSVPKLDLGEEESLEGNN